MKKKNIESEASFFLHENRNNVFADNTDTVVHGSIVVFNHHKCKGDVIVCAIAYLMVTIDDGMNGSSFDPGGVANGEKFGKPSASSTRTSSFHLML